ncbi:pentapeptide repeat-containing protein [Ilumatobacter sp.]|uniref:pentapeptide repeat-containing protein n=1 Tax=Ilumatobacter sp. TaxID=1967498 RepID=UPI003AF97326
MTSQTDFHGHELRGASFSDAQLDDADFGGADLRGADFTRASLIGADFTHARLGVGKVTGAVLLAAALFVSVVAGLVTGYFVTAMRERVTSSEWQDVLGGWLLLAIVIAFLLVLVVRGVDAALRVFFLVALFAIAIDILVLFLVGDLGMRRVERGVSVIGLLFLFGPAAVAGILGRLVGGIFGQSAIAVVAIAGGIAAGRVNGGIAAIVVSVLLVSIAKRALANDQRDRVLRRLAHRIITNRGTRFGGADLRRADFTGTALSQCDMSEADLTDAVWDNGKGPVIVQAE